jgi:hypothetical protein
MENFNGKITVFLAVVAMKVCMGKVKRDGELCSASKNQLNSCTWKLRKNALGE